MARTQAARKSTGGMVPRKLLCAYRFAVKRQRQSNARAVKRSAAENINAEMSESTSDSESEELGQGTGLDDLEDACLADVFQKLELEYVAQLRVDAPAAVLLQLNPVRCAENWLSLAADVKDAIEGRTNKHQLKRERSSDAFTLLSTRDIQKGEAVLSYTGTLRTLVQWQELLPDDSDKSHLWAYDIPANPLKSQGYQGPDLVIDSLTCGNESRFLQDRTWVDNWQAEANLQAELVWTAAPGNMGQVLPHIVYVAMRNISSGEELFTPWGDECWESLSLIDTFNQAAASWQLHYQHAQLVQLHQKHAEHVAGPSRSPSSGASGLGKRKADDMQRNTMMFDPETQKYIYDVRGLIQSEDAAVHLRRNLPRKPAGPATQKKKLPPAKSMYRELNEQELAEAFPAPNGCTKSCDFSALPTRFTDRMDKVRSTASREALSKAERDLIQSGELPGCAVVELCALHHDVRWLTPPDSKAYAVITRRCFAKGAPIGIYCGDVSLGNRPLAVEEHEKQVYAFEMKKSSLDRACGGMTWSDLVVDALHRGNISRFINDGWGQESTDPNIEARVVWDPASKRPYIMLYALRKLKKGEELLLSYGPTYWRCFARHLQIMHWEYYCKMTDMVKQLSYRLQYCRLAGDAAFQAELQQCRKDVDLHAKLLYTD